MPLRGKLNDFRIESSTPLVKLSSEVERIANYKEFEEGRQVK
jgi:hypothetical protein